MQNEPALTLVLLPGMDGTGDLFENLRAELPAEINTVVVRYPTNSMLSYAEYTALAALHVPQNTPYVLLGESFSGPIAIALAANASAQLKGVILSCTFAANPRPLLSKANFLLPTLAIEGQLLQLVSRLLMGSFWNKPVFEQLKAAMLKVPPTTLHARLDAVIGVDYLAELAKIKVPILYLKAQHDYLVPASAAKTILKFAKNVTLVELNAPHLLLQIAAQEAAKVISAFMAQRVRI